MGRAAIGIVVLFALSPLTACGAEDVLSDDEPLERLHGPVDPAVLSQPIERPTPPPVTAPTGTAWRVSNVLDGRTLELFQGLERVTATLGGIAVPTDDECLAQLATDSLAFITGGGRPVDVSPPTPTGGFIVDALVRNADGDDVALVMLTLGLAQTNDTGASVRDGYADAEAAARGERVGIWSAECDGSASP